MVRSVVKVPDAWIMEIRNTLPSLVSHTEEMHLVLLSSRLRFGWTNGLSILTGLKNVRHLVSKSVEASVLPGTGKEDQPDSELKLKVKIKNTRFKI